MSNILEAQDILLRRGSEFPYGPTVFVPWPLWMTSDRLGKDHFGVPMPSHAEALAATATFSTWSCYPGFAINVVNGALDPSSSLVLSMR